jgi:hypothetical protein
MGWPKKNCKMLRRVRSDRIMKLVWGKRRNAYKIAAKKLKGERLPL